MAASPSGEKGLLFVRGRSIRFCINNMSFRNKIFAEIPSIQQHVHAFDRANRTLVVYSLFSSRQEYQKILFVHYFCGSQQLDSRSMESCMQQWYIFSFDFAITHWRVYTHTHSRSNKDISNVIFGTLNAWQESENAPFVYYINCKLSPLAC